MDTKELIYKTETDSQTLKTNLWLPKGTGGAGYGWSGGLVLAYAHCGICNYWETGTCCIAQGTLTKNSMIIYMGKKHEKKEWICYMYN